jgi:hypothetical protein
VSEHTYKVVARHPVDTDDGKMVAPGGEFTAAPSDRLAALVSSGHLAVTDERPPHPGPPPVPRPKSRQREETP